MKADLKFLARRLSAADNLDLALACAAVIAILMIILTLCPL